MTDKITYGDKEEQQTWEYMAEHYNPITGTWNNETRNMREMGDRARAKIRSEVSACAQLMMLDQLYMVVVGMVIAFGYTAILTSSEIHWGIMLMTLFPWLIYQYHKREKIITIAQCNYIKRLGKLQTI